MQTIRQHLHTPTARIVLRLGGAALIAALLLAAFWWWHDNRPSPLGLWLAVKGLMWTKTALKIAVAAGLGVALLRRLLVRLRRRRPPGGAALDSCDTADDQGREPGRAEASHRIEVDGDLCAVDTRKR